VPRRAGGTLVKAPPGKTFVGFSRNIIVLYFITATFLLLFSAAPRPLPPLRPYAQSQCHGFNTICIHRGVYTIKTETSPAPIAVYVLLLLLFFFKPQKARRCKSLISRGAENCLRQKYSEIYIIITFYVTRSCDIAESRVHSDSEHARKKYV